MKLALLSDLHANLRALDACLDHARRIGMDQYAILGDLVGYGAQPAQVVERVQGLALDGAIVLQGNHDEMAVSPPALVKMVGEASAAWTHDQLSTEARAWLAALPLTAQVGPAHLVHASADEPAAWRYIANVQRAEASLHAACADPRVRYVFGGHVHEQTLYFRGGGQDLMPFVPTAGVPIPVPAHRRWIATVGSVGQPRDGCTDAMFAWIDLDRAQLTFERVPYDHLAAAADIRVAGLPEYFARRLEQGL
jgi:diadenosine tetraphosphatase ApaH/serine/threonine PP2A family protein phosphatase